MLFVNKINLRHSFLNRIGREFGGQSYLICHWFGTKKINAFGAFVWVLFWGVPIYIHMSSHMIAFLFVLFSLLLVWDSVDKIKIHTSRLYSFQSFA